MYISVYTVFLAICTCLTHALDGRNLLYVMNGSMYSLPELWEIPGVLQSSKYSKDETVDKLSYWIPDSVELTIQDVNFDALSYIKFDVTDTSNIKSLIPHNNIRDSYLFPNIGQYVVVIPDDNNHLLLAHPNDINMVYLAHGRFNPLSSNLVTCFSQSGSLFSLNTALQRMTNNKISCYDKTFAHPGAELTISLSANGIRFVNGISVYNPNSASTTFTLKYATWGSWCDIKNYNSPPNLTFTTDGNIKDLPVFMASCINLVFSKSLLDITVKLTKPAEDYIFGDALQIWGMFGPEPQTTTTTEAQTTTNHEFPTTTAESMDTTSHSITTTPELSPETTGESLTETTAITMETSTTGVGVCYCECDLPQYSNISSEEILKAIKEITDSLSVNKSELSSTIRQKTCANDDRPSARGVGYIGCAVLTTALVLMLLVDLHTLFTFLRGPS